MKSPNWCYPPSPRHSFQEYGPAANGKWIKLPFDADAALESMFGAEPELMPGHAFGAALANYLETQHHMNDLVFEPKYHLRTWEDAMMVLALAEKGKGKAAKVEYAKLGPVQRRALNQQILARLFPVDSKMPEQTRQENFRKRQLHALALDISADLRVAHNTGVKAKPDFALLASRLYQTAVPTSEQIQQADRDYRKLASEFCLESAYYASNEAFKLLLDPSAKGTHALDVERYRHLLPRMDDGQWKEFKQRSGDGAMLTFLYGIYDLGTTRSLELVRRMSRENPGQLAKLAGLWIRGRLQPVAMFWQQPELHMNQWKMNAQELGGRVQKHVAEELGFQHVKEAAVVDGIMQRHGLVWSASAFADKYVKDPGKLDALGQILATAVQTKGDENQVTRAIVSQLITSAPVIGTYAGAAQAAYAGDWQGLGLMAGAIEVPIIGQGLLIYSLGQSGYAIYDMEYARHVSTNAEDAIYRGFLGPETQAYGDSVRARFTPEDEKTVEDLKQKLKNAENEVLLARLEPISDAKASSIPDKSAALQKLKDELQPRLDAMEMKKRAWEEYRDAAWAGGYFSEWGAQKVQKPFDNFMLRDVTPAICFSPAGIVDFRATFTPADEARLKQLQQRIQQAMTTVSDSKSMLEDVAALQELDLRKARFERAQRYLAKAGLPGVVPGPKFIGPLPEPKRTVPELRTQILRDSLYPYFVEVIKEANVNAFVDHWFREHPAVLDELVAKKLLSPDPVIPADPELSYIPPDAGPRRLSSMPSDSVENLKDRLRADLERSKRLYDAYKETEKNRKLRAQVELQQRIEHYRAEAAGSTAAKLWGDPRMKDVLDAMRMELIVRTPPTIDATVFRIKRNPPPPGATPDPAKEKVDFALQWSVAADPTLYLEPYSASVDLLNVKTAREAVAKRSLGGTPLSAEAVEAIQAILKKEAPAVKPQAKPGKEPDLLIPIIRVWASGMADLSKADPASLVRLPGRSGPVLQRASMETVDLKKAPGAAKSVPPNPALDLCMGTVVAYGKLEGAPTQARILSFTAKPGNGQYSLECRYELSDDANPITFNFFENGDTRNVVYYPGAHPPLSAPKQPNPEYGLKGQHTAVFGPFALDTGEPKRIKLQINGPDNALLATSDEIQVAIPRAAWVLEGVRMVRGTPDFKFEKPDLHSTELTLRAALEGTALKVAMTRVDEQTHRPEVATVYIGPMPPVIPHGQEAGFWYERIGRVWEAVLHIGFSIPSESEKWLSGLNSYPKAKDFAGELALARKLGVPEPHVKSKGDGFAMLYTITGVVDPLQANSVQGVTGQAISPDRVKIVATISENEELVALGGGKKTSFQNCVVEWVYKKGTAAGTVVPVIGSVPGSTPGSTPGAAPGSAPGAGPVGAKPPGPASPGSGASPSVAGIAAPPGSASLPPGTPPGRTPGAALASPAPPTPEQMLASPTPWLYQPVQAAMDEWLRAARVPPVNGMEGRYDEWGVLAYGSAQRLHPDNKGMTRHQYLWTTCQRLTSVGHCTLGEYVRIKLTGGSLDNCRGPSSVPPTGAKPPVTPPPAATPPAAAPPVASVTPGPPLNQPLPQFSLTDSDGRIFRFIDQKGKVVLINIAGLLLDDNARLLERIQKAAGARVVVVAAEFARGMARPVQEEAYRKILQEDFRKRNVNIPVLIDWDGMFRSRFAPGTAQAFLLIDGQGVLRMRIDVGKPATNAEFRATLRELLPGIDWDAVLDGTAAKAVREKGPAETPEATFEALRKAGAEGDWAVFINCQSPDFRKRGEDDWEKQKAKWRQPEGAADRNDTAARMGIDSQKLLAMSNREFNIANWSQMTTARDRWKNASIVSKTPQGDRIALRVKAGNAEGTLVMVRINGLWYWDPSAK